MDEQNVKNEKKKELLNIYWFLLMVMAAVSLVNLLAISTDSMKAAAIVNVVLLFLRFPRPSSWDISISETSRR
ncbi:MAG: hypothetical protein L6V79_01085 [Clostridium sp.]|nr:MAG: hypothetical protein L6V79_01085 [Clostridium sp.]